MLEIRKWKARKTYENSFFREFAENIKALFDKYNKDGLLIANSECIFESKLQIDVLLITNDVVCLIDFKNFWGKIILPENGVDFYEKVWTNVNWNIIKWGSSINPFQQLCKQKARFSTVYNTHIKNVINKKDYFDPSHTKKAVCFQKEVDLQNSIPGKDEDTFFIINKKNYLEKIRDIIDIQDEKVSLSKESFDVFKRIFRAQPFNIHEVYDSELEAVVLPTIGDYNILNDSQKSALKEIEKFLKSDRNVFILQWTANSWKSYLIPFIQEIAYKIWIQETEIFAQSHRIANNLFVVNGIEDVNSLYSSIYGWSNMTTNQGEEENDETKQTTEEISGSDTEIIPIKTCDNSPDALFIVDEAHLIWDSYHDSVDVVFGSGHLLKDFLYFSDPQKTKRKIIFIGDMFQLQIWKIEESPLNSNYLEQVYNLQTAMFQLIDNPSYSDIIKQSLSCVDAIRNNYYNYLELKESPNFTFLTTKDVDRAIIDLVKSKDGHILCYTNEQAHKINLDIKEHFLKNWKDLAINDMVIINNNVSVSDESNTISEIKKIYNWQFAIVANVESKVDIINVPFANKKSVALKFRKVSLFLSETWELINMLSFENYRLNVKSKLPDEEIIAYKILLSQLLNNELKKYAFEDSEEYSNLIESDRYKQISKEIDMLSLQLSKKDKVKTKLSEKEKTQKRLKKETERMFKSRIRARIARDPSTEYFRYKNAVQLRLWWALTVHKANSYKWDDVILYSNWWRSKDDQIYFRLMYTGMTRAEKNLFLVDYEPISPFDQTILLDENNSQKPQNITYTSYLLDQDQSIVKFKEFISNHIGSHDSIKINNIEHSNYLEKYSFEINGNIVILPIYYNDKWEFNIPNNDTSHVLIKLLTNPKLFDLKIITDVRRQKQYDKLLNGLKEKNIWFWWIKQTSYKDEIMCYQEENELFITLFYTLDWKFSKIIATYYNDPQIWNDFQNIIEAHYKSRVLNDKKLKETAETRHPDNELSIFFDAWTGRGEGVEVSVTDKYGKNLLHKVLLESQINKHGKMTLSNEETNNYGELMACKYALQIALQDWIKEVFGDSKVILDYWSNGIYNKKNINQKTVHLINEVVDLRKKFEKNGWSLSYIPWWSNPADLWFHKGR